MTENTRPKKGEFTASTVYNYHTSKCFYKLGLKFKGAAAEVFADFVPGQFVQIDVTNIALPPMEKIPAYLHDKVKRNVLLRRPFSCSDVSTHDGDTYMEIMYCALGPSSLRMTTLEKGDQVNLIGPLGNGFSIFDNKELAILAVGGMGAGPMVHLAGYLRTLKPTMRIIALAGAKTEFDLPYEQPFAYAEHSGVEVNEFASRGVESLIATDNGSLGFAGYVTDMLAQWLDTNPYDPERTVIYSCGPEPMLAASAIIAAQRNIDCQVSMERMMGCGIGLCQSCAIECKTNGGDTIYKLCCKDGPVFDSREVVFENE